MTKPLIILSAVLALTPTAAMAVLDSTADECGAVYGTPTHSRAFLQGVGTIRTYLWSGFLVNTSFPGPEAAPNHCDHVWFEKEHILTGKGAQEITRAEIEGILALNAGDSSWENIRRVWRRRDNRVFAVEFRHGRNGMPSNTLAVFFGESNPDLAAKVTDAFNRR